MIKKTNDWSLKEYLKEKNYLDKITSENLKLSYELMKLMKCFFPAIFPHLEADLADFGIK